DAGACTYEPTILHDQRGRFPSNEDEVRVNSSLAITANVQSLDNQSGPAGNQRLLNLAGNQSERDHWPILRARADCHFLLAETDRLGWKWPVAADFDGVAASRELDGVFQYRKRLLRPAIPGKDDKGWRRRRAGRHFLDFDLAVLHPSLVG